MPYELREHTADVAVEATGDSLGGVFAAVADGLAAAMCDDVPGTGERFAVSVRSESPEAALYDYLDQLIYERDVRGVLPVDNEATVGRSEDDAGEPSAAPAGERDDSADGWLVEATARGVPLDEVDAREVKAVTYSEMALTERDAEWYAYVVFDV